MDIGDKLALARRYHTPSLSQTDLATLVGVGQSQVSRWEKEQFIPPKRLPKLAQILNVKDEWFTDGSDTLPTQARRTLEEQPNVQAIKPDALSSMEEKIQAGLTIGIPVWRGVEAGSPDEECTFMEPDEPEYREVPLFLLAGDPQKHVLCIASGQSMYPRINHAERALVRLDPDVPPKHLVIARSPDGRNFMKRLMEKGRSLELHSINEEYKPITELDGWTIRGGILMIWHNYEEGKPNLEWNLGQYLR